MTTKGLAAKATSGGRVVVATQAGRFGLQLIGMVLLSRILSPEDFGLVALSVAILGVADVLRDLGLSSAAIQAEELSHQQSSNLFWCNVVGGVVLAAAAVALAPIIGLVGGDSRLTAIVLALSFTILINATQAQFQAQLLRSLRFATVALTDLAAVMIGLVSALLAALLGWGYWALVLQVIVQSLALLVMRVPPSRFVPAPPKRGEHMGGLLRYGLNLAGSQLLVYLSSNLDTLIMGMRYSAATVGLYKRANQLVSLPLAQVLAPLTSVALAALSRCRNDAATFWGYFGRVQTVTAYVGALALAVGALNADWMIRLSFGPQWQPAAFYFSILCVAGILQVSSYSCYWAFLALGHTGAHFRYSLVSRALLILSVYVGSFFGAVGIPIGYVIGVAAAWPLAFIWLAKVTGVSVRRLMAVPFRAVALGFVAGSGGSVVFLWLDGSILPSLLGTVFASVCVAVVAALVPQVRSELRFALLQVAAFRRSAALIQGGDS